VFCLPISILLQRVQNAAAKLITKNNKQDHVTPLLYHLHWLPVEDRIIFKVLLVFKSMNNEGPVYLKDLGWDSQSIVELFALAKWSL
jgi:hypothetical protein